MYTWKENCFMWRHLGKAEPIQKGLTTQTLWLEGLLELINIALTVKTPCMPQSHAAHMADNQKARCSRSSFDISELHIETSSIWRTFYRQAELFERLGVSILHPLSNRIMSTWTRCLLICASGVHTRQIDCITSVCSAVHPPVVCTAVQSRHSLRVCLHGQLACVPSQGTNLQHASWPGTNWLCSPCCRAPRSIVHCDIHQNTRWGFSCAVVESSWPVSAPQASAR